jgi:ribosomal protein S18 acetylase RimI-like enzyme
MAELMTYVENEKAIKLYQNMGFSVVKQSKSNNPDVLKYYPGSGMVLMQIKLEKLLTT